MSISEIYESSEQKSNIAHFAAIANIALVDGQMNDDEIKLLKRFATKLNIDEHQYASVIKNLDKYPIPSANSKEERLEYIFELFRMIYVDHKIDEQELKLIHKYAIGLGCNSEKAKDVIKKSMKIFGGEISFENYKYLLDTIE
jgi:uncharacterized tellurite resistance protein B-like protein